MESYIWNPVKSFCGENSENKVCSPGFAGLFKSSYLNIFSLKEYSPGHVLGSVTQVAFIMDNGSAAQASLNKRGNCIIFLSAASQEKKCIY